MKEIMRDNLSELESKQMKIISNLQYKINLKDFDISSLKKEITILKRSVVCRKETIKMAIKELEKIRKEEKYDKISNVLVILNASLRERQ